MEDQKYSFQDFIGIIKRLRADDGCPWDREQTHQSLKNRNRRDKHERFKRNGTSGL